MSASFTFDCTQDGLIRARKPDRKAKKRRRTNLGHIKFKEFACLRIQNPESKEAK